MFRLSEVTDCQFVFVSSSKAGEKKGDVVIPGVHVSLLNERFQCIESRWN